jgi:hypothetical protein
MTVQTTRNPSVWVRQARFLAVPLTTALTLLQPALAPAQGAWIAALDHLDSVSTPAVFDPPWERAVRSPRWGLAASTSWGQTWYQSNAWSWWSGVGMHERPWASAPMGWGGTALSSNWPRLQAGGAWQFLPGWRLTAEFDANMTGSGRALDATARIEWSISPQWYIGAGWRTLDASFESSRGITYLRTPGASLQAGWRF